jgi:hypothetical protein
MSSKSAKAIQHTLLNHVITPFTPPYALRSDRESGIAKSTLFQDFAASMGIQLLTTATNSPQSNGQAENRIRQIKTLLKIEYSITQNENWDIDIHYMQIAMNKTIGIYGFTPEEIMFGTAVPSRIDLLQVTETPRTLKDFMEVAKVNLKNIRQRVHQLRENNRRNTEKWANKHRRRRTFEAGDIVKLRYQVIKTNSALNCPFRGPYIIKETAPDEHTCIIENLVTGFCSKNHFNHLEHLYDIPMPTQLNQHWDDELQQIVVKMNEHSALRTYERQ